MLREYKGRYSRELRRRLSERGRRMARVRWDAYHANAPEPAPKMVRYFPLEFGIRVKATGEIHWHDLVSVRHASKALGLIQKYCSA